MHELAANCAPKTNNYCEGENNRPRSMAENHRPHIWKLVNILKAEEGRSSTYLAQYAAGTRVNKRISADIERCQIRIQNIIRDYIANLINIEQFLLSIAYNIKF